MAPAGDGKCPPRQPHGKPARRLSPSSITLRGWVTLDFSWLKRGRSWSGGISHEGDTGDFSTGTIPRYWEPTIDCQKPHGSFSGFVTEQPDLAERGRRETTGHGVFLLWPVGGLRPIDGFPFPGLDVNELRIKKHSFITITGKRKFPRMSPQRPKFAGGRVGFRLCRLFFEDDDKDGKIEPFRDPALYGLGPRPNTAKDCGRQFFHLLARLGRIPPAPHKHSLPTKSRGDGNTLKMSACVPEISQAKRRDMGLGVGLLADYDGDGHDGDIYRGQMTGIAAVSFFTK